MGIGGDWANSSLVFWQMNMKLFILTILAVAVAVSCTTTHRIPVCKAGRTYEGNKAYLDGIRSRQAAPGVDRPMFWASKPASSAGGTGKETVVNYGDDLWVGDIMLGTPGQHERVILYVVSLCGWVGHFST